MLSRRLGSGQLEFEEFVTLAAGFLIEDEVEDAAAMQEELKEAFRLYDKEGRYLTRIIVVKIILGLNTRTYTFTSSLLNT